MLTKKQLKDAARCCGGLCELCSCNKTRMAYQDCIREAAKTALAYREMLEQLEEALTECLALRNIPHGIERVVHEALTAENIEADKDELSSRR